MIDHIIQIFTDVFSFVIDTYSQFTAPLIGCGAVMVTLILATYRYFVQFISSERVSTVSTVLDRSLVSRRNVELDKMIQRSKSGNPKPSSEDKARYAKEDELILAHMYMGTLK